MRNITEYGEFKNGRTVTENLTVKGELVNEGAQLYDDVWKSRMRVEVPVSLINAYVKKVQSETGEDPRKRWSEQEIAEEISDYVTTAFMTVENLPTSIIAAGQKSPTVQTQEEMPAQTQIEPQAQTQVPAQEIPGQPQAQVPAQETPAQNVAREIPATQPGQPQPTGASQI